MYLFVYSLAINNSFYISYILLVYFYICVHIIVYFAI